MISARLDRVVLAVLILLFGTIAVWNSRTYPPLGGFDAAQHIEYARTLIERGELPEGGASYTPPGFYVLAGSAIKVGDALGVGEPERLVQLLNAAFAIGTALLVLALARLLFPGRPLVHWAAVAFFACCPVVLRTTAMFHPQPLAMLLAALALTQTAQMIVRKRYGVLQWVALALTLAAGQLVRSVGLWTIGVVVLALLFAAVNQSDQRRRIGAGLGIAATAAILLALPWYVHLQRTTDSAVLGRNYSIDPFPPGFPASFYVSPGLPEVITDPHRGARGPTYLPILYADTWGDYFGIWSWNPPRPELTSSVNRRLTAQSVVGLPLTALALAGWLALCGLTVARRHRSPALMLVALMPAAALAGTLYYATRRVLVDGDTIKAMFLLTAIPAWAISFGFAVDVLVERSRRLGLAVLAVLIPCLAVSLAYATFAFVS
jgi:4-amino-4-deoxy-L-arabinose transferase-like glycosyltransferase